MKKMLKDHPNGSSSKTAQTMTYNSIVVGVVLFTVLSVAAFVFFPILIDNELSSLEERLIQHESLDAHTTARDRIQELEVKVAVLEAHLMMNYKPLPDSTQ